VYSSSYVIIACQWFDSADRKGIQPQNMWHSSQSLFWKRKKTKKEMAEPSSSEKNAIKTTVFQIKMGYNGDHSSYAIKGRFFHHKLISH